MSKIKCAIIGPGNIGTDLMIKMLKYPQNMELAAVVGIDPASEGLAMAREHGIATTHEGIEGLKALACYKDIRIAFDPDDGAWSYVGTDNRGIPLDQPTMNLGFMDGGTTAHEFGHAIGLAHEHQNPAGGMQWNEAAVIRDLSGPPNSWNEAQIRHNVLNKYRADQLNGTSFDPDSIMLYAFPGSWVQSGQGTHANEVLSAMDKAFIASARAYPKAAPTIADAQEIVVNATRRTAAAIGKAGEEDLFRFQVKTGGTHIVDTRGPTDVVMKLFGPDSPTAVIAEDDDSGVDTNASIRLNLLPGTYYAQVRHYNKASGMGNYSVRVRKL